MDLEVTREWVMSHLHRAAVLQGQFTPEEIRPLLHLEACMHEVFHVPVTQGLPDTHTQRTSYFPNFPVTRRDTEAPAAAAEQRTQAAAQLHTLQKKSCSMQFTATSAGSGARSSVTQLVIACSLQEEGG